MEYLRGGAPHLQKIMSLLFLILLNLPTITGECSVTLTTEPTATDNVDGTIKGTTDDPRSYTEQGTYTVLWTYTDKAGNSATQTQTIIVKDTTPPKIESISASPNVLWPPNHKLVEVYFTVDVKDNCSVTPTVVADLSY